MYYLENICSVCLCGNDKNNVKTLNDNLDLKSDLIFALPEIVFQSLACICLSCYATICSYNKFKKKCMLNYERWQQYSKTLHQASQVAKFRQLQISLTNCVPPAKLQRKQDVKFEQTLLSNNDLDLPIQIYNKQLIKDEFTNNNDDKTVTEDEGQIFTITLNINEEEIDQKTAASDAIDIKNEVDVSSYISDQKTVPRDAIDLQRSIIATDSGVLCEKTDQKTATSNNEDMIVEPDIFIGETDQKTVNKTDENEDFQDENDVESEESESDSGYKPKPYRQNVRNSKRYNPYVEYPCILCNEILPDRALYNIHIKLHSKTFEGVQCTLCPKKFQDNFRLQRHILFHLCIKDFKCSVCHKCFKDKYMLKLHVDLHLSDRNIKCYLCTKTFSVNGQLKQHIKRVHVKKEKKRKNFECTVCKKAFINQRSLVNHMKYHRDEKDFVCTICGKDFYTKGRYTYHMKLHKDDKERECTVCNKIFPWKSAAKLHLKYHLNIRDFECEICHKKFVRNREKNNHIKTIHEKIKIVRRPKNVTSISIQTEDIAVTTEDIAVTTEDISVKTEEVCIVDVLKNEFENI